MKNYRVLSELQICENCEHCESLYKTHCDVLICMESAPEEFRNAAERDGYVETHGVECIGSCYDWVERHD